MSQITKFTPTPVLPEIHNENIAWIKNVGDNLIKSVTIYIDNIPIHTHYNYNNNNKSEDHNDLKEFLYNKQYGKIFDLLNVIEYKSNDLSNKECEICCDNITNAKHILKINCNHIFCAECIFTWHIKYGKESCPKCRQKITTFSKCKIIDAK